VTRTSSARVAGFTYLAYIALAFPSMLLFDRAASGEGTAARLASIAVHATDMRVAIVLTLITCFAAIALGATLYAITREVDPDIAMVALACRVGEGILAAIYLLTKLELLWLGTVTGTNAPDAKTALALGELLFTGTRTWNIVISATFFAVGSTLFSWLLLRGRIIPVSLAGVGVVASALLAVCLPLQLAGLIGEPITSLMWLPMLAFEVPLGFWLLIKGARAPARGQTV
jgi:hypothetical protein